jgi:hypothetical protein
MLHALIPTKNQLEKLIIKFKLSMNGNENTYHVCFIIIFQIDSYLNYCDMLQY